MKHKLRKLQYINTFSTFPNNVKPIYDIIDIFNNWNR